jgi:CheY-like chemotaxis protein
VFSVRVPRCEDAIARQRAASVAAKPAVALPSSLVGLTVLCVDNEQEILDGMQALLGRWGMKVLTARDSDEALRLAGSERPQVLLVDYRLSKGDRDGLDLLEELSRGRAEPLAAALITADHGSDVAERARSLGIPLMRKPVKPAALRAMLSALAIRSAIAATGTNGA